MRSVNVKLSLINCYLNISKVFLLFYFCLMLLIDSHTHLYLEEFSADIQEVIAHSFAADVKYMVIPNVDNTSIVPMLDLCRKYSSNCFPTIGLHPESVKQNYLSELESMKPWLDKERFVAIGEIGIDLYWDKTFVNEQMQAFKSQLLWAKECDLPVIIHSRNALNEIIQILNDKNFNGIKAVFHCFPGSLEQAIYLTNKGYMLGIGGVVTFKNSGLAKVVKEIPLEYILLETDAPYLTPVPYRGKRNESAYIKNIAEFIALLRNCPLEEVAEITTQNAMGFFNLPA
jgi:TatD DNase family protein